MLSYRHGYHAGNFADVMKHGVLCFTMTTLQQKEKPLYLLETHAGAGAYDLTDEKALKTGEARAGIARVLAVPGSIPVLWADYLDAVRAYDASGKRYPGSPALMAALLRPQDRMDLVELHSTDFAVLAKHFARQGKVRTLHGDGFAALKACMPPLERRGLVLMDPSYEVKSDYEAVVKALAGAHRRFATGTYILWYPMIDRRRTEVLMSHLAGTRMGSQYRIELCMTPDTDGRGMTGAGLVVINPPRTLPGAVREGLPWLAKALGATGPLTTEWLVPEE